ALGSGPHHADAVIDTHEQCPSIFAAKAQVRGPVAGQKAAQEGAVGCNDANTARARGEDVAVNIAFHAVDAAALGGSEFPLPGAHEYFALARGAVLVHGENPPGAAVGHIEFLEVRRQGDSVWVQVFGNQGYLAVLAADPKNAGEFQLTLVPA